jgi:hypothetical protein
MQKFMIIIIIFIDFAFSYFRYANIMFYLITADCFIAKVQKIGQSVPFV